MGLVYPYNAKWRFWLDCAGDLNFLLSLHESARHVKQKFVLSGKNSRNFKYILITCLTIFSYSVRWVHVVKYIFIKQIFWNCWTDKTWSFLFAVLFATFVKYRMGPGWGPWDVWQPKNEQHYIIYIGWGKVSIHMIILDFFFFASKHTLWVWNCLIY